MKRILIIEPTVFIWFNKKETLFYNTLNKKSLYYNDSSIIKIAEMLESDINNYIIELNDELLNLNINFFNEIQLNNFGYIEYIDSNKKKPIQIHPIPSVQRSSEMNKKEFQTLVRGNIEKHLTEISIFFNSKNNEGNNLELHKQFIFPITNGKQNEIDVERIISFLDAAKYCPINKLNIVGYDLFNYKGYAELTEYLAKLSAIKNYYLSLSDFKDGYSKFIQLNESQNTFILTLFDDYDKIEFINFISIVAKNNIDVHFRFMISHENQVELFEKTINDLSLDNYSFIPYFDKTNYQLFKENVFLTFDEVLDLNQDIIDIHAKEYINPMFFGKLFLLPDNNVYSDLHNDRPIAYNSTDFSIQEALFKALTRNNKWRLTRNKVKDCKHCVAKFICPPISNYEIVFNQYKICDK